ncbi:MAG: polymerase subunit chi [Gammaproteobacteria bacterium]|jgi:DNA polymerase-3 subunit chi|nr:polymerase subunit chi [Gammaproteobacteria bacterium]
MTERVDFYVLKSSTAKQRWTFACRLTEKAYLRDLKVVLFGDTLAEVEAIDELLWTFSERSFVPHDIHRGRPSGAPGHAAAGSAPAVQLTPDLDSVESADLLVNVSARLPARLDRFARIAEIIDADDERRRLGRERFKAYRDLKLAVETHQLDDASGATP